MAPATMPKPDFDVSSAATSGWVRAKRIVSRVDSTKPGRAAVVRSANDRRTRRISSAEIRNESASTPNARSRPARSASVPPRAAPTAAIVPHAEPSSTLAWASSPGSTRLGSALLEAGKKNADPTATIPTSAKASAGLRRSSTRTRPSAAPTRNRSAMIMIFLRSNRSATAPVIGASRKAGSVSATMTAAVATSDPVISKIRPSSGTTRNQSPMNEMSCAA